MVSTSHLPQTLSLPAHCFQTQGFISPSRMLQWRTPSPSFPLVHQVPSKSIPMILWFYQRLSVQHEMDTKAMKCWCYKPLCAIKCSAFHNSPDDHRTHSALRDPSVKWSSNRWHSSNMCISIKPALFLPVLWTWPAAQLLQQNCLDKWEEDCWKQLTGVKATTKWVLSCASTNFTAEQRSWRITLGSRTCGWGGTQIPSGDKGRPFEGKWAIAHMTSNWRAAFQLSWLLLVFLKGDSVLF